MDQISEQIATVAHSCWRLAMEREGWRYAPQFDAGKRLHDALVPFPSLSAADRASALLCVEAEGLEQILARSLDYPRGPDRPFTIEDAAVGQTVGLAGDLDQGGLQRGVIVRREVSPEGDLQEIVVRWDDGSESRHHPAERELRRVTRDT